MKAVKHYYGKAESKMKKIILPNGLEVSAVALGAMNFGTTTSENAAYDVLDAYLDVGGNFVDTSNNYAHWAGTGDESETVLGNWFEKTGNRDKVVLATKVGFDRHGQGAGLKKEQIMYWVDESLRKMKTDYIDLYYVHYDDVNTPQEEYMEAFDSLVKQGKVLHLGASNMDTWRFADANHVAEKNGFTPFTVMQQRFSYLYPKADVAPNYPFNEICDRERLRFLENRNIPLVSYACLAKGGYEKIERMPADFTVSSRLDVLKNMAAEKGVNPSALVVAWLSNLYRCHGFPQIIPLFSSSKPAHFLENLRGVELELSDEEMETLNKA